MMKRDAAMMKDAMVTESNWLAITMLSVYLILFLGMLLLGILSCH